MRGAGTALAIALALAACAPSKLAYGKVRSALVDAGLSDSNASCMATRMTDRLSIGQLKRLQALQGPKRGLADYVATVTDTRHLTAFRQTNSSGSRGGWRCSRHW
ncbi:MAG: hypothetical protein ACK4Z8_13950 [Novosphingobium sp.]